MATMEEPAGIGWTALVVALQRGAESRRPDALFGDPLAEAITDEASRTTLPQDQTIHADAGKSEAIGDYLAIRTVFFDNQLINAARDGITQIVIPAAGMDGRAFRLPWPPGTRLYEIDLPEVLDYKTWIIGEHELTPTAERAVVAADLREDWPKALLDSGFDPTRPSAWVLEGLVCYLTRAENDQLLAQIEALATPGSRIAVEYPRAIQGMLDSIDVPMADSEDKSAQARALLSTGPAEDPVTWFGGHGWKADTVLRLGEFGASINRPAPASFDNPHTDQVWWLANAIR